VPILLIKKKIKQFFVTPFSRFRWQPSGNTDSDTLKPKVNMLRKQYTASYLRVWDST